MVSPLPDEKGALLFVNIIHSPEKENEAESSPCIARVRKPFGTNSTTKPLPVSNGTSENKKPTNKSCLLTRPRAVLSSPENDCMIGKRNKLKSERCVDLKCKLEVKMVTQSKLLKNPESHVKVSKALKVASRKPESPVQKKGTSKTNAFSKPSNLTPTS